MAGGFLILILRRYDMRNYKINILGTQYEIVEDAGLRRTGFDGLCRNYGKTLQVRDSTDMLDQDATEDEKRIRYKETVRHELVHAFFFESGLDEYCENEQLVSWIAIQFPKMLKVFQEAECM